MGEGEGKGERNGRVGKEGEGEEGGMRVRRERGRMRREGGRDEERGEEREGGWKGRREGGREEMKKKKARSDITT